MASGATHIFTKFAVKYEKQISLLLQRHRAPKTSDQLRKRQHHRYQSRPVGEPCRVSSVGDGGHHGSKFSSDSGSRCRDKITRLFLNWRDYEPYKEAATKSADTAFDEFTKIPLQYHSSCEPERIVVTDLTLKYYSQPAAIAEKHLQPVYVFEGYVKCGNDFKPFDPVYIPATIEQYDQVPGGC